RHTRFSRDWSSDVCSSDLKQMQYVTAARALGYKDFRIITKHILPNVMAPVIVISAANFASAILIESGLSFLGIGAQSPIPSWGRSEERRVGKECRSRSRRC